MADTPVRPKQSKAPLRISVVEDEPTIRETLAALFIFDEGFELVNTYPNAEAALAGLPGDAPDQVLLDIGLPGMNGIELLNELTPVMKHTQFLMYTMHDDDQRVFDALKAGADGYILKSSTPDQIIEAIHELSHGGAPMSTAVARRVIGHFRPKQLQPAFDAEGLTEREFSVLELLAQGLLYKEIAERLHLSVGTVKQHIHRMYQKLHVQNRVEAVNKYYGR